VSLSKTRNNASSPSKQDKPWPLSAVRGYLRKRGKLMFETARGCIFLGRPLGKPQAWAFLIAEDAWHCYRRKRGTLTTFRYAQTKLAPRLVISDAAARKALKRVGELIDCHRQNGESYHPTSMAVTAKRLGVTAEEAERYGWTPDPEERREKDRLRKREARRKASAADKAKERERVRDRRRRNGARPHAESLSQKQPWRLEGVGRSQWYARRRTNSSVRLYLASVSCGRTFLSGPELARASSNSGNGHDRGPSPALGEAKRRLRQQRKAIRQGKLRILMLYVVRAFRTVCLAI
jgi:hypothetical protein